MARKLTSLNFSSDAHPVYFADQPAALLLGGLVSKITFGAEDSNDEIYPKPVVTVVMPTLALLQLVNDLKKQLDSTQFKKHAVAVLGKQAREISEGGGVTSSDKMIDLRKSVLLKKTVALKKSSN